MKINTQLLWMTTQTDDESVWKKHLRKQKNEWGTDLKNGHGINRNESAHRVSAASPRANSEHHSQHSPPGLRVGWCTSFNRWSPTKKTASFCLKCWFLSIYFFKALICVLHHCHWFNWFVLHCYHPISLTLWANKVLIGDVVRTHCFNGCTRFTNYLSNSVSGVTTTLHF